MPVKEFILCPALLSCSLDHAASHPWSAPGHIVLVPHINDSCTFLYSPVWAAEIMKRRILGLHQVTAISSVELRDHWEPKEEGLDSIDTTRHVSVITITLSKVSECCCCRW